MPQWLEKRSPKLARMFSHIVKDCQNRDKGKWDLPADVENCYEYAMGRIKKEPEFKKGKAYMSYPYTTRRKTVAQSRIKQADPEANVNRIMANLKKSLLRVEQEAKIVEQELEDLRYIAPPENHQEAFEAVPRIMTAQEAVQDAVDHILAASERIDVAKERMRGTYAKQKPAQQSTKQYYRRRR